MKNKVSCLFLIALVHFSLFFCFMVPPAFPQKASATLMKYKVEILPFKKKTQEKYQLKLIHPYSFQLKTIQKSLVSLRFKKKDIFNVQKGRVFNNDLVKRLAPLIRDKFSLANKNQRVAFKVFTTSRKIYIRGDTFMTPEGLHLRLTALRGVRWGIEDFSVSGEPWGLVLQPGQVYKQRYWNGSALVTQDIVNWIILKKILPSALRRLPEPVPPPSSVEDTPPSQNHTASEIKKRLHLLEQLRQENVITEKEYANKRKEILGLL